MTDFPSTPTLGDLHTYAGIRYRWDGSKWVIQSGTSAPELVTSANGEVDLSKGVYHKLSTNVGRKISFSNIPSGSSKWSLELDVNTTSKYDIAAASLTGANLTFTDTSTYQTYFKPDGTMLYVVGDATNSIYVYNLATPWDLSTSSLSTSVNVSAYDTSPAGIAFDPTGNNMYLYGNTSRSVYQLALSNRWDITSVTLTHTKVIDPAYPGYSIRFKPDGLKMYVLIYRTSTAIYIYEYDLTTAWDISTASSTYRGSPSLHTQDGGTYSFDFNNDGTKLFTCGYANDRVYRYSLSTPWNVSTASYDSVFMSALNETSPYNISFDGDGSRLFVSGQGSDKIQEYSTESNYVDYTGAFTFPDNIEWNQAIVPTVSANDTKVFDFYSPNGGTTIYGKTRFASSGVAKPGLYLVGEKTASDSATGYTFTSLDISQYANRNVRLVFGYHILVTNTSNPQVNVDLINFNGSTYSFENTTHNFQTSNTTTSKYGNVPTANWVALIAPSSSSYSYTWSVLTPGGYSGTHCLCMSGSPTTAGNTFWARSPIINLNSSPNLSFYSYKWSGTDTKLSVYIDVIN